MCSPQTVFGERVQWAPVDAVVWREGAIDRSEHNCVCTGPLGDVAPGGWAAVSQRFTLNLARRCILYR